MVARSRLIGGLVVVVLLLACGEQQKPPTETPPSDTKACGGVQGLTCATGQYCNLGIGKCQIADAQGVCEPIPDACTEEFKPVCGCDGKTYSNACKAAAAGMSIDHEGSCKEAKICGGIAGVACDEGQYCDLGEGQCKVADAQGVCKVKPQACTRDLRPVCGCDGKTYSNACLAASAGVSIDAQGECG